MSKDCPAPVIGAIVYTFLRNQTIVKIDTIRFFAYNEMSLVSSRPKL